jgi:hypothetical protein
MLYRKTLFTIPWGKNRVTKNLASQKSLISILNILRWQIFLDSMSTPWDGKQGFTVELVILVQK